MTAEEIISSLSHSKLPTVIVEGKDDLLIYRWFEKEIQSKRIEFFPCGGRTTLFKVYENRAKFSHLPVLFIADQDMFVFTEIPEEYENICFTKGYSIENDLFADGEQNLIEELFPEERIIYQEILESLIEWFAFEVEIYLKDPKDAKFSGITLLSNKKMLDKQASFSSEFLTERDFKTPSQETVSALSKNYPLKMRGKFLFQVFLKIHQQWRDSKEVDFTTEQMWKICFVEGKKNEDGCVNRIFNEWQKLV